MRGGRQRALVASLLGVVFVQVALLSVTWGKKESSVHEVVKALA